MDVGNSPVVGVELFGEQLRAVKLQRRGKGFVVEEKFDKEGLVVSALESSDVLVRQLQLDVKKEREIAKVRDFQAEALLPVPLEEAVLCHQVVERSEEGVRLAVVSALKSRVADHLEVLGGKEIEPERVCCVPVALAQLMHELLPVDEPQGVIHLGAEGTSVCVVKGAAVLAAHSVAMGARDLGEMPKNFLDFDLEGGKARQLRAEIAKSLLALTRKRGQRISQVFVTGEFAAFPNLEAFVAGALEVPVSSLPDRLEFEGISAAELAVPLGLALGALKRQHRVDFRQRELAYRRPFRRLRGKLTLYAAAALLLAGALGFWGEMALSAKRQEVGGEYARLEQLAGEEGERSLSLEEMRESAAGLGKQLRAEPDLYPLVPNVPRVSDVLAWLGEEEAIRVESLNYTLVRRPDQKNGRERYRVRLDLEFGAESHTKARAFHDKLLAGHPLIDGSSEVRWSTQKEHYRASFFLRDRTFYPGGHRVT